MDPVTMIKTAGEVVGALAALKAVADPLIKPAVDAFDADAAKKVVSDAVQAAGEQVDKAKGVIGDAANAAQDALGKIAEAKDQVISEADRKKAEKAFAKAIKELRQTILENATVRITVADYLKAKEKAKTFGPINTMPGCFVIATYKKLDFDKNLIDYLSVFVGKAANVAEGVDLAISRDGDPDVYADVKYKQNVHIYVYNCLPEELEEQYTSLAETFADVEMEK